jgi:hypothetical protein
MIEPQGSLRHIQVMLSTLCCNWCVQLAAASGVVMRMSTDSLFAVVSTSVEGSSFKKNPKAAAAGIVKCWVMRACR